MSDLHSTRIHNSPVFETIDLERYSSDSYVEYFGLSVADHTKTHWVMVIIQCFKSHSNIFNPGFLHIPETDVLFVGAGDRISAFRIIL